MMPYLFFPKPCSLMAILFASVLASICAAAKTPTPDLVVPSLAAPATQISAPVNDIVGTLTLETVLDRSSTHFPAILESLARRRAAQGDFQSAQGAFDLVFAADGFDRVSGTFDGQSVNTSITKQLRPLAAQIYGGYRRSGGNFPIYENINFTNRAGEFKIGGLFSLLRDRQIDSRRVGVRDAALAIAEKDFEVLLTRVGVQHRALLAYWQWVAAGHQLDVYEELFQLAENRQSGLDEQVRRGARAAIFLTENRQNVLRRQRLATDAKRSLNIAANRLSFYLRDMNGNPILARRDQLPSRAMWQAVLDEIAAQGGAQGLLSADTIPAILRQRPELNILKIALERADLKVALGENDLKPRFDLRAEVSTDMGGLAKAGQPLIPPTRLSGFGLACRWSGVKRAAS